MKYYVGIDLGGTNLVAGVVDESYRLLDQVSLKTRCPRPGVEIARDMAQAVRTVTEKTGVRLDELAYVGVGSPGVVDVEQGEVIFASNLGFRDEPLASHLSGLLGVPVLLCNDADAAAYGEFMAGAGKGARSLVAITIGTGVGSGIILDSKIYSGFAYGGGELGHTIVEKDGVQCSCGRRGCMDVYASATGLIRMTKEMMREYPESAMWAIADSMGKVSGRTAFHAMYAGDAAGAAVVERYTSYLGECVVNVANLLQPEVICIGGGISKEGDTLLRPINKYVEKYAFSSRFARKQSRVQIAELGGDAGVIGAALIGLQAK